MIFNLLTAMRLLTDACASFTAHALTGLAPDEAVIARHVGNSLMLVTALSPVIGYDRAAEVAHRAHVEGTTLKEACLALGYLDGDAFDSLVDPMRMARPHEKG